MQRMLPYGPGIIIIIIIIISDNDEVLVFVRVGFVWMLLLVTVLSDIPPPLPSHPLPSHPPVIDI